MLNCQFIVVGFLQAVSSGFGAVERIHFFEPLGESVQLMS